MSYNLVKRENVKATQENRGIQWPENEEKVFSEQTFCQAKWNLKMTREWWVWGDGKNETEIYISKTNVTRKIKGRRKFRKGREGKGFGELRE